MALKKSKFGCLSIFGLTTLAVLGGTAGYAYQRGWHQLVTGHNLTPLSGAALVPDEALVTGFISTDKNKWQQIEKLGVPLLTEGVRQIGEEIEREFTQSNIDYQNDIEPWLGNAMVAFIPYNNDYNDPDLLLVAGIKNPINAYKFLRRYESGDKDNVEIVSYRGEKVSVINGGSRTQTNIAILGNKIVLSDNLEIVKRAIDTTKGETSFASIPENKTALKQKLDLKNNLFTFYLTDYDRLLANVFTKENFALPEQLNLDEFQPVESLVFGMGTTTKQLSFQSLTLIKDDVDLPQYAKLSNNISQQFPQDTVALVTSQGISNIWNNIVSVAEEDEELSSGLNGMRNGVKWVTGLDIDKDIFGWMDGEFAIGIVTTKESVIPEFNLNLGTAILIETSDRATAENTLNVLGEQIQAQSGLNSQTITVNNKTVTQWSIPDSNLDISYGWIDRNNLLFTWGNNTFSSVGNANQQPLEKSTKFQKSLITMPRDNISYFYLDMEQVMDTVGKIPYLTIDNESEPIVILNSIESVGATSIMTDSKTAKGDMVILFK